MGRHSYRAFGLEICSDLELPELFPSSLERPDVTVERTPLESVFPKRDTSQLTYRRSQDGVLSLEKDGLGRIRVVGGERIQIDPDPNCSLAELRAVLIGSAFGALLHQRNAIALHASGVVIGGKAVLFTGASGAGKSTLAAALSRRGFPAVADDLAALDVRDGKVWIEPAVARLKLWPKSVELLELASDEVRPLEGVSQPRFQLALSPNGLQSYQVRCVVALHAAGSGGIGHQMAKDSRVFHLLFASSFRPDFLPMNDAFLQRGLQAAEALKVAVVWRPRDRDCLQELADYIVHHFGEDL